MRYISIIALFCASLLGHFALAYEIKGINLLEVQDFPLNSPSAFEKLTYLKKIGANSIGVNVFALQKNISSTDIFFYDNMKAISEFVDEAQRFGIEVVLRPLIELENDPTHWRGDINPSDINKWGLSYEKFLFSLLKIAKDKNLKYFSIGAELVSLTHNYPTFWPTLLQKIKNFGYAGELTYSHNWGWDFETELQKVTKSNGPQREFFCALDFVSLDLYSPLSQSEASPSLESLMKNAQEYAKNLSNKMAKAIKASSCQKKFALMEMGFRSQDYATKEPWVWHDMSPLNLDLQARALKAIFSAYKSDPLFKGLMLWNMTTSLNDGGEHDTGFSLFNKPPAESAISAEFL